MSKKPSPAHQWLEQIVDHVVVHGLSDASLRGLAEVAGTSHAQLSYYFGSRDGLLGAVLARLRQKEGRLLVEVAQTRREAIWAVWHECSVDNHRLEMQIFFHLAGTAVQEPARYSEFLDEVVAAWADRFTQAGLRAGLPAERARSEARLIIGTVRGLLLDFLLTGEREAAETALRRFMDLVDPPASP